MRREEYVEKYRPNRVAFQERYKVLLMELADMPCGSQEEKDARSRWFKARDEHGDLILEMMKIVRTKAYNNLMQSYLYLDDDTGEEEIDDEDGEEEREEEEKETDEEYLSDKWYRDKLKNGRYNLDTVLADGEYSKGVDYKVFVEGVQETIRTYKGFNSKGEEVLFLDCVTRNLRKKSGDQLAEALMKDGGVSWGRKRNSNIRIGRLVLNVLKEFNGLESWKIKKQMIYEKVYQSKIPYSKEEIQIACDRVCLLELLSMDMSVGEDSENTYADLVAAPVQSYYEGDEKRIAVFLQELANDIDINWKIINAYMGKISRDIFKALLTKDILIELKMVFLPDCYKDMQPEPKCRQWCHRVVECPPEKKEGCFVRYDVLYHNPPYGSGEIYYSLEPAAEKLYEMILSGKYLDEALIHNNFRDVYVNKLYPNPALVEKKRDDEKYFDFSDSTLAKALGKDKGQISKARKIYETVVRGRLYEMFVEEKKIK